MTWQSCNAIFLSHTNQEKAMSDYYLGEIRLFPYTNTGSNSGLPRGWVPCDGRTLPAAQNQALYALLGTIYGGDTQNFKLPDLRGRLPISQGVSRVSGVYYEMGQQGGLETVPLTITNIPSHTHTFNVSTDTGTQTKSVDALLATPAKTGAPIGIPHPIYGPRSSPLVALNGKTVGEAGNNAGHDNMQSFIALTFAIATMGLWPPRQ
jgi:microcystin-dependent protein